MNPVLAFVVWLVLSFIFFVGYLYIAENMYFRRAQNGIFTEKERNRNIINEAILFFAFVFSIGSVVLIFLICFGYIKG